jgi:hypothetical protein
MRPADATLFDDPEFEEVHAAEELMTEDGRLATAPDLYALDDIEVDDEDTRLDAILKSFGL